MRHQLAGAAAVAMLAFFGLVGPAGAQKSPDVNAILAHLDDLYRSKSSIARIEMIVTTSRSTRVRSTRLV